ncbi:hypothetical protein TYRP_008966 [Tyrophagus putrescentiae]|nr:hypothetical protein TYRP_008966 [Tyrophagus putrescentiae]
MKQKIMKSSSADCTVRNHFSVHWKAPFFADIDKAGGHHQVTGLSVRSCGYLHPRDHLRRLVYGARNEKRGQNDVRSGEELRKDGAEEQHLNDGGHVVAVEVEEVHPEDVHRRETEGADEEHVRKELPIALQQVNTSRLWTAWKAVKKAVEQLR